MSSQSLGYFSREVIEAARERRRAGREARISHAENEIRARRQALASDCKETKHPHDPVADRVDMQALEAMHRDYLKRIECASLIAASDRQSALGVD